MFCNNNNCINVREGLIILLGLSTIKSFTYKNINPSFKKWQYEEFEITPQKDETEVSKK